MSFERLPPTAAWRHHTARDGFESVFIQADGTGYEFVGTTAAVEAEDVWVVAYEITVDAAWHTVSARVSTRGPSGARAVELTVADGRWTIDGSPRPELDGCRDVDLESSAFTNMMPVHRLALGVGAARRRTCGLRARGRRAGRAARAGVPAHRGRRPAPALRLPLTGVRLRVRPRLRRVGARARLSGHRDPGPLLELFGDPARGR